MKIKIIKIKFRYKNKRNNKKKMMKKMKLIKTLSFKNFMFYRKI